MVKNVGLFARLLEGAAAREARQRREKHAAAVCEAVPGRSGGLFHGERHEDVGFLAHLQPPEARRRHAHDLHVGGVDPDRSSGDVRIGRKATVPERVREDHHRMGSRGHIIGSREQAPGRWQEAEHFEVGSRHQVGLNPLGVAFDSEEDVGGKVREHAAEGIRLVPEVGEHRVRHRKRRLLVVRNRT